MPEEQLSLTLYIGFYYLRHLGRSNRCKEMYLRCPDKVKNRQYYNFSWDLFHIFLLYIPLKSKERRCFSNLRNTLYRTSYQYVLQIQVISVWIVQYAFNLFSHVWGKKLALKRFNVKNTKTYNENLQVVTEKN